MNIKDKIIEINKEKKALENKYTNLKTEFKNFITDINIPVLERWDFFTEAPAELKETNRWMMSPKTKFMKYICENWFSAPECYGRGKRIMIANLFEELIYDGKIYLENFSFPDNIKEDDVKQGLEELLQLNLDYFTFDW